VDPDQFNSLNPAEPLDPPNSNNDEDNPSDPDPDENPVDTMVTKEPMNEIIKNEEVYLAQEQDEQVSEMIFCKSCKY